MPDTSIDLSEGIQSVRLKVPTAVVPIPPEGFAQLHSPAPGELALRLPDGSVVAVGGGGDFALAARNLLGPNGQVLTNSTQPGVGIDITPIPPLKIRLSGPVEDANGQPQAPEAVTLELRSAPPPLPTPGHTVYWADVGGFLHALQSDSTGPVGLLDETGTGVLINGGIVGLLDGSGAQLQFVYGTVTLGQGGSTLVLTNDGVTLTPAAGALVIPGLPTADPHVDGQLWIAPITRQLMVSAG